MVLTLAWIAVIAAVLVLSIAWGGTIDRASIAFMRTRRPPRPNAAVRRPVAPASPR